MKCAWRKMIAAWPPAIPGISSFRAPCAPLTCRKSTTLFSAWGEGAGLLAFGEMFDCRLWRSQDTRSGELRRGGVRIRLQEQPFQILVILLEHAGEVVVREQLIGRLWPDNTFVDFDRGLNKAIGCARLSGIARISPVSLKLCRNADIAFSPRSQRQRERKNMARCCHRALLASIPSRYCRLITFPVIRPRNTSPTA